jgi:GNAT superfamily N-acetyltransferase/Tat protein secretion system quality control protein TatD with DNase activity
VRHGSIMTLVREAAEDDNDALNELQKKCPMGTNLVLGVDSSPDYFARSKPFKDWHVLVAVENGTIVGSAAYAISDTYVEGKQLKTAYEYGFIVDPLHRRKGIGEKLQGHIEHAALEKGVNLLHLGIIEDNFPSISLFSKMGFEKVKDCTTFSLIPYKRQRTVGEANIRSMDEADVDDVINLINEMYRDYNFFAPFQPEDFLEYLRRMPHFDFHNILVLQGNGNLEACLGYWDYSKVRRYIVEKMNRTLRIQTYLMKLIGLFAKMPRMPRLGEPILSYNLTTMACRNSESMAELIKFLVNIALENKVNLILAAVDPTNPIAAILSKFRHTEVKLHFFTKSLRQERLPNLGERKLYIDAVEM